MAPCAQQPEDVTLDILYRFWAYLNAPDKTMVGEDLGFTNTCWEWVAQIKLPGYSLEV
jgi:hypothetical protein